MLNALESMETKNMKKKNLLKDLTTIISMIPE